MFSWKIIKMKNSSEKWENSSTIWLQYENFGCGSSKFNTSCAYINSTFIFVRSISFGDVHKLCKALGRLEIQVFVNFFLHFLHYGGGLKSRYIINGHPLCKIGEIWVEMWFKPFWKIFSENYPINFFVLL